MGTGRSRTKDRRYDAGAGRFISEDLIKGHTAVPYTMNHYSYCFNRPMDLVNLNGMWPSLKDTIGIVAAGIATASVATASVATGLAQAGVGKVGNLLGSGAGLKAGTLANGIWNGFSNLLGFSIGDISYIQTGVIYDGMQNLLNYEKDILKNAEKSKE